MLRIARDRRYIWNGVDKTIMKVKTGVSVAVVLAGEHPNAMRSDDGHTSPESTHPQQTVHPFPLHTAMMLRRSRAFIVSEVCCGHAGPPSQGIMHPHVSLYGSLPAVFLPVVPGHREADERPFVAKIQMVPWPMRKVIA